MRFAIGVVCPLCEAGCEFLQTTSDRLHNRRKFFTFYKGARFAVPRRYREPLGFLAAQAA